jgi:IS5 family transposase
MDVEYPTDIGLLWDAMRRVIVLTAAVCRINGIPGWRQSQVVLHRMKNEYRKAQQSKRSRKADAPKLIEKSHRQYLKKAEHYLEKVLQSVEQLEKEVGPGLEPPAWSKLQKILLEIAVFHEHATRQINQIRRRVLNHETIPSAEKVFSVFEPHVEWISKGKAGVPFELGLKVCIVEDQYQFILHHRVMQAEQDVDVAVPMMEEIKRKHPNFDGCSFDKGFHSPGNQAALPKIIPHVVLPPKGRLSAVLKEQEEYSQFKAARRQHSAVESAINALEHHGLDRCPDRGIEGFKRYVSLAVLSRNLQRLGAILTQKEREALRKLFPLRKAA